MRARESNDDDRRRFAAGVCARLAVPLSISIVLHIVLALTLVGVELRRAVRAAERLEVRLVVLREPAEVRVAPPSSGGAAATLMPVEPTARRAHRLLAATPRPGLTAVDELGPVAVSAGDVEVAPAPMVDDAARERAERLRELFDPLRVARRAAFADDLGPILPSGPAGLGPAGESVRPLDERTAEATHDGYLRGRAGERPELHETPIVLEPHPDGTYTWQSSNFLATIHPDGAVSFSDRGPVEYDLATGTGRWDLSNLIMGGAGADPFASERERFVEENRELIEALAHTAWEADRREALVALRSRCVAVWGRDASAAERRAELFEVWHELSPDEPDRAARDAVLDFIRRELPPGSADAYTDEELEALNLRLGDGERFAP